MLFRRRPSEPSVGPAGVPGSDEPAPGEQHCPSLAKAAERVFRKDKPEILDLGPLSGRTVVHFAGRGARVTVDEFDIPEPPVPTDGEDAPPPPPLRIAQPDARFDLVLAWEQPDFIPPDRLDEFAAELRRVVASDGWLLVLSLSKLEGETDRRARYRIVGEDKVVREPLAEPARPRWVHPTRNLERALQGFSIQGIHLQRNQVRELLAVKRPPKKTDKERSSASGKARPAGRSPRRRGPVGNKTRSVD